MQNLTNFISLSRAFQYEGNKQGDIEELGGFQFRSGDQGMYC